MRGAPVAQSVKRWPTDPAVPNSSPARDEIFSTVNEVPLHTAFHYFHYHRPDTTEMLFKKDVKPQVIYPSYPEDGKLQQTLISSS